METPPQPAPAPPVPEARAFRQFWLCHHHAMFQVALRFARTREEAEDALQEICAAVHRSLPSYRGEASVRTWMTRVAENTCKSLFRERRPPQVPLREAGGNDPDCDDCPDPGDAYAAVEARYDIDRLLATLPPREAMVMTMFHLEGAGYSEIATTIKAPVGTVCTLLYRARRKLQKQCRKLEGEAP